MPRLFLVTTEYPPGPGGISTHAHALVSGLRNLGWETDVAALQSNAADENIEAFNQNAPYTVLPLPDVAGYKDFLHHVWRYSRHIRNTKTDLVVGSGKHACWYAYLAAKLSGRPAVMVGHGTEFGQTDSPLFTKLNRRAYSKAKATVFVSHFTQKMAESSGVQAQNGVVIHNGADPNRFFKEPPETWQGFLQTKGIPDGAQCLLTVGNMSPRKGQEWLIRAMPSILKEMPNVHYAAVGNPQFAEQLTQLAKELQVEQHVHLIGRQTTEEIRLWYNAASLYVITSAIANGDFEGFGISVIEAALCGKTAVVTNNSGLMEAIEDGKTGLSANEKSPESIATSVLRLLSNHSLRQSLEQNAWERANRQFTWDVVVEHYHRLFLQAIS